MVAQNNKINIILLISQLALGFFVDLLSFWVVQNTNGILKQVQDDMKL